MRDQLVRVDDGTVVVGATRSMSHASLEMLDEGGAAPVKLRLSAGALLLTIEALAMAYGELCGARPDSLARGVNRTIANRTRAARERQRVTPATTGRAAP